MRVKGKLFLTTAFAALLGVGVFDGVASQKEVSSVAVVEAASLSKTRIVLELEDQCWSTSDSRDPILHLWSISIDSSMEFDSTDLTNEMTNAGIVNDLETGGANVRQINSDGSIDTGFSWIKEENSKRYWSVKLPWYITGFTFKLHCGSYWGSTERTVTKHGSHMVYNYGSWNSWDTSLAQDTSSISNSYSVTNYAITASSSGGVSGDGHTAQVKGNGGSYVSSGNYFPRQKISIKATAGTYSSFDHWNAGHDASAATTYDYVGTAAKTYTATFSDTRSKFTVVFKDEDGTTLETKSNVYQGSSVSPSSTPTKPDEGGKYYTFDKWRDSSGNDKTSALANVQSDLTVYASYTSAYRSGRYAYGKFGTCDWGVEGAVYMPSNGTQYEGQITLSFGDKFKIAYYDGSSMGYQYGYSSLLTSCGAYHYFTNDEDDNLVCYARGTYNLYFRDTEYATGKKISIELEGSLNAEHLAAELMGFGEWAGHCGDNDRFPAMKAVYLGLSPAEQTTFQGYVSSGTTQFKNAYDRYTAWARALGENPWAEGKASSAIALFEDTAKTTGTVIIVIVISAVSLAAIGGYFLFRKKKEN